MLAISFGTPNIEVIDIMQITEALGTAGVPIDSDKVIVKIIKSAFKSTSTPYILRNRIAAKGI